MKKISQFLVVMIVTMMTSVVAEAQICVKPEGRVQVGNYEYEDQYMPNHTATNAGDTISLLKLFGYNDYGAGARITFGDQFSRYTYNVSVGELSRHDDTDRLWLHGKNGFYVTSSSGAPDTICYYDQSRGTSFHFNTDVIADGFLMGSDSRFKHDIKPLDGGLSAISRLNTVSYKLNPHFTADGKQFDDDMASDPTGKAAKDAEFFKRFYDELAAQPERYGFIAQQVEQVMPELIHTDKAGYKYVDYIGIIPLLVNAVQELQAELAAVRGDRQDAPARSPMHTAANADVADGLAVAALHQNIPNPFSADTHIRYCLPESVQQADLYVYDMQGHQVKKIAVAGRGESSVTIHGSELQAGMYIYALIADGQEVDTKRMILTK